MTVLLIIIGIIIIFLIGYLGFIFIGMPVALANQKKFYGDAWNYWKKMCHHKWDDLSEQEKEQIILAYLAIQDDCGGIGTEEEIRKWLPTQLPYKSDGSCPGFERD